MGQPRKYSSVRIEGIGSRTVVRGKGEGGGKIERRAPLASTRDQERQLGKLLRATPVNTSMNSRPSRGAPSPTPLQPHPNRVLPSAQVGGGANFHTGRWTGKQEKRIWSEASQRAVDFRRTDGE